MFGGLSVPHVVSNRHGWALDSFAANHQADEGLCWVMMMVMTADPFIHSFVLHQLNVGQLVRNVCWLDISSEVQIVVIALASPFLKQDWEVKDLAFSKVNSGISRAGPSWLDSPFWIGDGRMAVPSVAVGRRAWAKLRMPKHFATLLVFAHPDCKKEGGEYLHT